MDEQPWAVLVPKALKKLKVCLKTVNWYVT